MMAKQSSYPLGRSSIPTVSKVYVEQAALASRADPTRSRQHAPCPPPGTPGPCRALAEGSSRPSQGSSSAQSPAGLSQAGRHCRPPGPGGRTPARAARRCPRSAPGPARSPGAAHVELDDLPAPRAGQAAAVPRHLPRRLLQPAPAAASRRDPAVEGSSGGARRRRRGRRRRGIAQRGPGQDRRPAGLGPAGSRRSGPAGAGTRHGSTGGSTGGAAGPKGRGTRAEPGGAGGGPGPAAAGGAGSAPGSDAPGRGRREPARPGSRVTPGAGEPRHRQCRILWF